MLKVLLLSGALALTAATAQATTVFTDNFNSDTPATPSAGDGLFHSTSSDPENAPNAASVDIIGSGPNGTSYDLLPGNGYYVDLDGTSGNGNLPFAGQITSYGTTGTFAAGNYVLTFELAGNQRGAPTQTTVVDFGSFSTTVTPTSSSQGFETYTFNVDNTLNGAHLQFSDIGPSTQQGSLLDNVSVSAVPEPATWAMMLLGFFGMAFAIRSNRRSSLRLA